MMTWIDLNVPYYGTSESNHYQRKGCRRLIPTNWTPCSTTWPPGAARRATPTGIPRTFYTRILQARGQHFLLAPLAKSAGGTEACGQAVFASKDDPDYQAILATFEPIHELLEASPRMDMTDAVRVHGVGGVAVEKWHWVTLAEFPEQRCPAERGCRRMSGFLAQNGTSQVEWAARLRTGPSPSPEVPQSWPISVNQYASPGPPLAGPKQATLGFVVRRSEQGAHRAGISYAPSPSPAA